MFRTRTVQLYIVISSRHRFAAGNWDEYRRQSAFECEENERLSSFVLPPELDATIYDFDEGMWSMVGCAVESWEYIGSGFAALGLS